MITKYLTYRYIPHTSLFYSPDHSISIFHDFLGGVSLYITHLTNTGAAWGVFGNFQIPLLIIRIILIVSMVIYICFFQKNFLFIYPLILIISGAIGNVLDYFFYGHVIDMIGFDFWGYSFPRFNIADSAITIGVIFLLFLTIFTEEESVKNIS